MTINHFYIFLLLTVCISCKNQSNKNIENVISTNVAEHENKETELNLITEKDTKIIKKNVQVISVEEALIMPSDYLTTAMTVETDENKQLVFLDMDGFEKLVGEEITIEYQFISGSKLLVCFNCSTYSKKIELFDITAFSSNIEYKELQLKKYTEDEYIIPSSTFEMLDKNGKTEVYTTNDNDMILDSLKMKDSYYKYGVITKIHPELVNGVELKELIK